MSMSICYHAKMPLHVLVSNIMAQLNAGNVIRHRIQHYHENDIYVIYTELFINRELLFNFVL